MKKLFFIMLSCVLFYGCTNPPSDGQNIQPDRMPDASVSRQEDSQTEPRQISPEEEEFNASGQAKAITDETDMWQVYDDPDTGFSLKYPMGTDLDVKVKDIGAKEAPMDLTEEEEAENIEALSRGEFGMNHDFIVEASKKVKSVGFLFAQDYMVLSRFEVCNVVLERTLLFYFNNKEIKITLNGDTDALKEAMPDYFTVDSENCGEEKIWAPEKQDELYQVLEEGTAPEELQTWFDLFDEIAETVTFSHR